jgi:hypothetical protein
MPGLWDINEGNGPDVGGHSTRDPIWTTTPQMTKRRSRKCPPIRSCRASLPSRQPLPDMHLHLQRELVVGIQMSAQIQTPPSPFCIPSPTSPSPSHQLYRQDVLDVSGNHVRIPSFISSPAVLAARRKPQWSRYSTYRGRSSGG